MQNTDNTTLSIVIISVICVSCLIMMWRNNTVEGYCGTPGIGGRGCGPYWTYPYPYSYYPYWHHYGYRWVPYGPYRRYPRRLRRVPRYRRWW